MAVILKWQNNVNPILYANFVLPCMPFNLSLFFPSYKMINERIHEQEAPQLLYTIFFTCKKVKLRNKRMIGGKVLLFVECYMFEGLEACTLSLTYTSIASWITHNVFFFFFFFGWRQPLSRTMAAPQMPCV